MATSGITINQLSRDDIINAALRKLVVIGEGQTANANQLITGAQALNNIVAEFRTLGMSVWARKQYTLPLVIGQSAYTFGIGQTVNTAYPLRIYSAQLEQPPSYNVKIDMNQMSFVDFNLLPSDSTGVPVNFAYQPQVNKGVVSIWPTPDASTLPNSRIVFTYQAPFEYFITGVDTPDFPEEWNNALIYQLCVNLSDEFGKPLQDKSWYEKQAEKHLSTALSAGAEEASLYITPNSEGWDYPNQY